MKIKDMLDGGEKSPLRESEIPSGIKRGSDEDQYEKSILDNLRMRIVCPDFEDRKRLVVFKECMSFCTRKVSITRKIWLPPFPGRGQKGFILDEESIKLFPLEIQKEFAKNKEEKGVVLVLFYLEQLKHEWVMALPAEDLKILKTKG